MWRGPGAKKLEMNRVNTFDGEPLATQRALAGLRDARRDAGLAENVATNCAHRQFVHVAIQADRAVAKLGIVYGID